MHFLGVSDFTGPGLGKVKSFGICKSISTCTGFRIEWLAIVLAVATVLGVAHEAWGHGEDEKNNTGEERKVMAAALARELV